MEERSDPTCHSPLLERTRRHFFRDCGIGLGSMALAGLLQRDHALAASASDGRKNPLAPRPPHFAPKAKRVIYLFMAGGPSQFELFSYKPELGKLHGKPPPPSFFKGKRFAFLKGNEKLLGPQRSFERHGRSGTWVCDLLPEHRRIVDDLCFVHTVKTDVFNHGPAKIFMNTGAPLTGRPSMGAWLTYGIGSVAEDLPGFVVLQSGPRGPRNGSQLWSSGFLPSTYQGVPFSKGRRAHSQFGQPGGCRPASARSVRRRRGRPESLAARRRRRSRNRDPYRLLRDGVPHADERPGSHGTRLRIAGDARSLRGQTGGNLPSRRTACSLAASSSVGFVSCSSITPTGTTTVVVERLSERTCRQGAARSIAG